jgi:hypothetical protein
MLRDIFTNFAGEIISTVLISIASILFYKRKILIRKLKCLLYKNQECRVSFACMLRLRYEDKYLLIKNYNRPELYGAIGGVYKYYSTAIPLLDSLFFRPQHNTARAKNDLRGFIPINKLNAFIDWFNKRLDREELDCLTRKLKEELILDAHITDNQITTHANPKYRLLHKIEEGPYKVNEMGYVQYRHLSVYDLLADDDYTNILINYLVEQSKINDNILLVTSDEIKKRRAYSSNKLIGSHCGYLIGEKRTGTEDVHYN